MSYPAQTIYCTQCGQAHSEECKFCSECGSLLKHFTPIPIVEAKSQADVTRQFSTTSIPNTFDYKKYCANCGKKLNHHSKSISGGMHICESCLSQCSNSILPQINYMTLSDIKNHIDSMNKHPEFVASHVFSNLFIDAKNYLWRVSGYPIYRIQDILDFEVFEERESRSISRTQAKTKKKGGLGGAVVGGVLLGVPGAVIGGIAGRRSITVASTHTNHNEYFSKLGLRIIVNDVHLPMISVDFINGRILVTKSRKVVDEVNNASSLLSVLTKNCV